MSQTEYSCGTAGEIKPCPFCGNEAVIGRSKRAVTVGCDFNDCPSRECYSSGKLEDESSVIASWNTRHPSPTPANKVLVPLEPTPEMHAAGVAVTEKKLAPSWTALEVYRAMIRAALK